MLMSNLQRLAAGKSQSVRLFHSFTAQAVLFPVDTRMNIIYNVSE